MSVSLWLEKVRGWDEAGFHLINGSLRNRFFDLLMSFVSHKWNFALPLGVLLVYVLLFRSKRDRIIAIAAIAVILLTDATSQLLKELFQRTRPVFSLYDAIRPRSFSFPSSHASNMFALAAFISYYYRGLMVPCLIVAALVGYSRIYQGSHYPIDVLAGALLGTFVGWLGAVTIRRFIRTGGAQRTDEVKEEKDHPVCGPDTLQ
jgi:undecaprenyl-diphosphatase